MKVEKPGPVGPLQLVKSTAAQNRFSDVMAKTPSTVPPPLPRRVAAGAAVHISPPAMPKPSPVPPGMTPRLAPARLQAASALASQAIASARVQVRQLDARAQAHASTQQVLATARTDANDRAVQLEQVRVDPNAVTARLAEPKASLAENQRVDHRVLELIVNELKSDPGVAAKAANENAPSAADRVPFPVQVAKAHAPDGEVHAAQAVELIEKIEVFVKSQRPALALTLNNSLGARVEIERIGPREVALKVVGKDGPPNAEDLGRIREAMKARGLKVGALSVA